MEVFTLKIRASAAQGCLVPIQLRLSQQVDTESEEDFFGEVETKSHDYE